MDYLQYFNPKTKVSKVVQCFKPYYKWITFNTKKSFAISALALCFKPYYKWITFNTVNETTEKAIKELEVLNLIINGLPSIPLPKG